MLPSCEVAVEGALAVQNNNIYTAGLVEPDGEGGMVAG
jgi:hypothetical protein